MRTPVSGEWLRSVMEKPAGVKVLLANLKGNGKRCPCDCGGPLRFYEWFLRESGGLSGYVVTMKRGWCGEVSAWRQGYRGRPVECGLSL